MYLQSTEDRYSERRMQKVFFTPISIFNWKKDKIIISYPKKLENWEMCHLGDDEVNSIASYSYVLCC